MFVRKELIVPGFVNDFNSPPPRAACCVPNESGLKPCLAPVWFTWPNNLDSNPPPLPGDGLGPSHHWIHRWCHSIVWIKVV